MRESSLPSKLPPHREYQPELPNPCGPNVRERETSHQPLQHFNAHAEAELFNDHLDKHRVSDAAFTRPLADGPSIGAAREAVPEAAHPMLWRVFPN
jgi:hypothetical protein